MLWNRWSKKNEIKIWNEKRKTTKNRKLLVFVFFDVLLDQTFLKVRKNLWKIRNVDFSSESFIFFRTTKRDFNKTTKKYFTITFIILLLSAAHLLDRGQDCIWYILKISSLARNIEIHYITRRNERFGRFQCLL